MVNIEPFRVSLYSTQGRNRQRENKGKGRTIEYGIKCCQSRGGGVCSGKEK